jgi:hypothetical protein
MVTPQGTVECGGVEPVLAAEILPLHRRRPNCRTAARASTRTLTDGCEAIGGIGDAQPDIGNR